MKSNNFVIREVPMLKLFNVEHCTNAFGDLSNFIKTIYACAVVVLIQEDQQ
jgi:hypothetical protein